MDEKHVTVLLKETVDAIDIKPDGVYVDCTLGGGGHSALICSQLDESGTLIGIDQDDFAIGYASERLKDYQCQKHLIRDSFFNIKEILRSLEIEKVDGIIYDLGVSSFQFDMAERGFSYQKDGLLDMRMDRRNEVRAATIVNTYSKEEIIRILKDYGEEKFAVRIADKIIIHRQEKPIETTLELTELIKQAYPSKERFKEKHPARKSFQALRIAVNHELDYLEQSLRDSVDSLKTGGRIGVITFHSLEDRLVKQLFNELKDPCICPKDFPVCVCGRKPQIQLVNRKPVIPDKNECEMNRRARSAKLRVAEKI